ncbi:hypothetical protein SAMD00019534_018160 [Acytostelium subglobosum LB1]|uniref:hypothetical protein n=1 Tax=Acytostelium subglobosum LB1 TaxID=1410327 RepID=UPI000644D47C|nr:hypothetical protein SAMD00019534_018160 [Acytostelium subglobosum LB1]GAM18641.1 hypothetical protein SAMD00019534_018160 [Acytostelium subglobosum LB1]|eukprot:XP_012757861.1 hypothetical protein SAMD00019534_018160 [Acytostelium subglobosum LB1]
MQPNTDTLPPNGVAPMCRGESIVARKAASMVSSIKDQQTTQQDVDQQQQQQQQALLMATMQSRQERFRRADSIAIYKSKRGMVSQAVYDEPQVDDDQEDDSYLEEDEQHATSTSTSTTTTMATTTTTTDAQTQEQLERNPLSISQDPGLMMRSPSFGSDQSEIGYDDHPVYKTISKPYDSDLVKPITSPIPNRPVFQVDTSAEHELINHSLIALRTSIRVGSDDITSMDQSEFELIKRYKISIAEKKTTVKDFAPNVFQDLRNRAQVHSTAFLKSWSSYVSSETPSKVPNTFTIYSSDRRYILRTISKSHSIKIRKLLPHYYNYLVYNPNAMLSRYLGLFRVEKRQKQNFYVVLLLNPFNTCCNVDQVVSTKANGAEYLKNKLSHRKIHLDPTLKSALYKQMEKDSTFLSSHDLVDYNMIIGINRVDSGNEMLEVIKEHDPLPIIQFDTPIITTTTTNHTDMTMSSSQTSNSQSPNNYVAPIIMDASSSSSTSSSASSSAANISGELSSSLDGGMSSNNTIVDPIKTIPRLLFFLEEIECITKSNNYSIGKSLKRSFISLPRTWSFDDVVDDSDMLNATKTPPAIPSSPTASAPNSPGLFTSVPNGGLSSSLQVPMGLSNTPVSPLVMSSSSVLLGFQSNRRCKNGFYSDNGHEIYYFGIVDIFASVDVSTTTNTTATSTSTSSSATSSPASSSPVSASPTLAHKRASSSTASSSSPLSLVSKMKLQTSAFSSSANTFLRKFLTYAKSIMFMDTSVLLINSSTSKSMSNLLRTNSTVGYSPR